MRPRRRAFPPLLLAALLASSAAAQLSRPIATDADADAHAARSHLAWRAAVDDAGASPLTGEDEHPFTDADAGACGLPLTPDWTADAHASLYATPLITDLFSDGAKEVVAPGFVDDVDVFDAATGARWADGRWPARHGAPVHASPLAADVDGDGVAELLVVTYGGDVLAWRDNGERVRTGLAVPRLRVRRGWHAGLAADPTSHASPDVGAGVDAQDAADREAALAAQREAVAQRAAADAAAGGGGGRRRLAQAGPDDTPTVSEQAAASYKELFGVEGSGGAGGAADGARPVPPTDPASPHLSVDAVDELLATGLDADEVASLDERLASAREVDAAGRRTGRTGADLWGADPDAAAPRPASADALGAAAAADHVLVDAHVLGTPALGDVDGDGEDELVVAVSYFFDRPSWPAARVARELGRGVDPDDYVAAGVVALKLGGGVAAAGAAADGAAPPPASPVLWATHLDLSTARTRYQARAFGGPTLADVDRDGALEVVVGTGMGFVYVLDGKTGAARDGWPLQMGAVQASVTVADIDDDGRLELIAGDEAGTLAALAANGTLIWERHLAAAITAAPSVADIDGDGALEIVVGTASGAVHAVAAATGVSVGGGWPFVTRGRVVAPVTLAPLGDPGARLRALVASFDGRLYAITADGRCADSVDVGEAAYAAPLVDDLDGDGATEILLATMSGALHALRTGVPADPLTAVREAAPGGNGPVARGGRQGVVATRASRAPRDARGRALPVTFDIVDERGAVKGGEGGVMKRGPYRVSAVLTGVTRADLAGRGGGDRGDDADAPVVGVADTFAAPGRYTVSLPVPRARTTATVRLEMVDESGIRFVDEFSLSFHVHAHRAVKHMVAAPALLAAAATVAAARAVAGGVGGGGVGGGGVLGLPSYARRRD